MRTDSQDSLLNLYIVVTCASKYARSREDAEPRLQVSLTCGIHQTPSAFSLRFLFPLVTAAWNIMILLPMVRSNLTCEVSAGQSKGIQPKRLLTGCMPGKVLKQIFGEGSHAAFGISHGGSNPLHCPMQRS